MTEAFAPIERRKVYEQVSERLSAQIGTTLQPGDALPSERELAERYGVGRSSVREALRMLESRGLIESRGSGTFVIAPWRNPFQEPLSLVVAGEDVDRTQLFEVRRMLEAEAAALAAERRSLGDLELMHEATDEMEAAIDSADAYVAADIRYHLVIAEATGNRLLLHLMQAIRERLTEMFGTVFKFPGGPERSIAQHRLITQAIAAEDAERARQAMTEHILRVEQELAQLDR
jgi:GntR family transcriptional regulator, transcriptional repressor for pyruvate dehydrogenase complex